MEKLTSILKPEDHSTQLLSGGELSVENALNIKTKTGHAEINKMADLTSFSNNAFSQYLIFPTILFEGSISPNSSVGSTLYSSVVSPSLMKSTRLSRIANIASNFTQWCGSMTIRIIFTKAIFMQTKIIAAFLPGENDASNISISDMYAAQYHSVMNPDNDNELMFELPFISGKNWLNMNESSGLFIIKLFQPLINSQTAANLNNNIPFTITISSSKLDIPLNFRYLKAPDYKNDNTEKIKIQEQVAILSPQPNSDTPNETLPVSKINYNAYSSDVRTIVIMPPVVPDKYNELKNTVDMIIKGSDKPTTLSQPVITNRSALGTTTLDGAFTRSSTIVDSFWYDWSSNINLNLLNDAETYQGMYANVPPPTSFEVFKTSIPNNFSGHVTNALTVITEAAGARSLIYWGTSSAPLPGVVYDGLNTMTLYPTVDPKNIETKYNDLVNFDLVSFKESNRFPVTVKRFREMYTAACTCGTYAFWFKTNQEDLLGGPMPPDNQYWATNLFSVSYQTISYDDNLKLLNDNKNSIMRAAYNSKSQNTMILFWSNVDSITLERQLKNRVYCNLFPFDSNMQVAGVGRRLETAFQSTDKGLLQLYFAIRKGVNIIAKGFKYLDDILTYVDAVFPPNNIKQGYELSNGGNPILIPLTTKQNVYFDGDDQISLSIKPYNDRTISMVEFDYTATFTDKIQA